MKQTLFLAALLTLSLSACEVGTCGAPPPSITVSDLEYQLGRCHELDTAAQGVCVMRAYDAFADAQNRSKIVVTNSKSSDNSLTVNQ